MTELIYREDAYAQQISAKVLAASAEAIVTDRTNFYAQAGGQPGDTGLLRKHASPIPSRGRRIQCCMCRKLAPPCRP
jgi:misacylated tRNA(Ala) deacylase